MPVVRLAAQQQHKTRTLFGTDGTDSPSGPRSGSTSRTAARTSRARGSALDKSLRCPAWPVRPYGAFGVPTYAPPTSRRRRSRRSADRVAPRAVTVPAPVPATERSATTSPPARTAWSRRLRSRSKARSGPGSPLLFTDLSAGSTSHFEQVNDPTEDGGAAAAMSGRRPTSLVLTLHTRACTARADCQTTHQWPDHRVPVRAHRARLHDGVHGVLKLLNFAHGDVYMVGAYIGYFVIQWFGGRRTSRSRCRCSACSSCFVLRALGTGILGVAIERFAYRPLRDAPPDRAADHRARGLVHARELGAAAVRRLQCQELLGPPSFHVVLQRHRDIG